MRATGLTELAHLDDDRYEGLAFGAEFCAQRLPAPEAVGAAWKRCRSRDLGFAVVTPVVREGALDRVQQWLEAVASRVRGVEWVANDWGLLHWASDRGLPLQPVAGRLLGRQRRGPRVLSMVAQASREQADALRGSAWDDPSTSALLPELGVTRVELDMLLQGVRRPSLPPGVSLSVCGPWIPVTWTPSCSWSENPRECLSACSGREPVSLECDEDPHLLWSRGSATFLRLEQRPPLPDLKSLGADRLVWAAELPG